MEIALPGAPYHPSFERRMDARRVVSWCLIVVLHAGFFYAMNNGLDRHVSAVIPHVIMAIMVPAEEKPVEPPKPAPPTKKIVPPVKRAAPPPKPAIEPSPAPSPAPAIIPMQSQVQEAPPAPLAPPEPPAPAPTAAAAPAPVAAEPKTISGVEYLQAPRPEYPPVSRRRGEEGIVQLRVLINAQGRPERVDIVKSSASSRLDEAARQAVMRAVFKPYLENGRPLAVYALLPIRFHLD